MKTAICQDFRDLLAECAWRGLQQWELEAVVVSRESLLEVARLGDETTYLNIAGVGSAEDRQYLSGLLSWLDSGDGCEYLRQEGQRWRVQRTAAAAVRALTVIKESLQGNWTPARAGMLARALPAIAASRFDPIASRLGAALKVGDDTESLITAYADAFCRDDRSTLQTVDRVIIDEPVLGTLTIEMAGRLLSRIGAADLLDPASKEKVISCLALLIDGLLKRDAASRGDEPFQNAERGIENGASRDTGAAPPASPAY